MLIYGIIRSWSEVNTKFIVKTIWYLGWQEELLGQRSWIRLMILLGHHYSGRLEHREPAKN